MVRASYVHMYPTDWRSGCLGLNLEQEGLYMRICMYQAEAQRRIPLDDTQAARMLNVQTRNYRRVLGELLRLGKVERHEDGYGNQRIEKETKIAQAALDRKRPAQTEGQPKGSPDPRERRIDNALSLNGTSDNTEMENSNALPIQVRSTPVITPVTGQFHQQNQSSFIDRDIDREKKEKGEDARAREPLSEVDQKIAMRNALNPMAVHVLATSTGWELNGSTGLRFANGKLEIEDETIRAVLRADFPGVDLSAVCNKAGSEVARSTRQTHALAMAAIRKAAQWAAEDARRAKPGAGLGKPQRRTVMDVLREEEAAASVQH